jgi:AraC-like DNA-binding protein
MLESNEIDDGKDGAAPGRQRLGAAAYFRIDVPAAQFLNALDGGPALSGARSDSGRSANPGYLIPLNSTLAVADRRLDGKPLRSLLFPHGILILARLLDAGDLGDDPAPGISLYLERAAFDQLADEYGCEPIDHLTMAGDGRKHPILRNLAGCLEADTGPSHDLDRTYTDHIIRAIKIYLAVEFGGLTISPPPRQGGLQPWQLRLARGRLAADIAMGVSLENVARACGLSLNHFSRAFRQSTGVSPHRWILQRRILAAKQMMQTIDQPLAQIAAACGFSDQSHLHRVFTSIMGMTPHKWRTGAEPFKKLS